MVVQNVAAVVNGSIAQLTWEVIGSPIAITVQFATDYEFTKNIKSFIIPTGPGAWLDIGNGAWFFRIGSWIGKPESGVINWTPTYGPLTIVVQKMPIKTKSPTLPVLHVSTIVEGLRIHTGVNACIYAVIEYSKDSRFPSGSTKTLYALDWGRGYFDVRDLEPFEKYSVRIATFTGNRSELPTESIAILEAYQAYHGKTPMKAVQPSTNSVRTSMKADDTILREIENTPNPKFGSHSDYIRYITAKSRAENR